MESPRFTGWFTESAEAPGAPALVQVKVMGALLSYPQGRSAMVWYGAIMPCTEDALERVLAPLRIAHPDHTLGWRYIVTASPEPELNRLLARFQARFGALPGAAENAQHRD